MWYKNICSASFSFVTNHACDRRADRQTDRRTDRITTPKTALAYARAVKMMMMMTTTMPVVAVMTIIWKKYNRTALVVPLDILMLLIQHCDICLCSTLCKPTYLFCCFQNAKQIKFSFFFGQIIILTDFSDLFRIKLTIFIRYDELFEMGLWENVCYTCKLDLWGLGHNLMKYWHGAPNACTNVLWSTYRCTGVRTITERCQILCTFIDVRKPKLAVLF